MSKKIAVIGGGSWGTALAVSLSTDGHEVRVWDISKAHVDAMQADRENKKYLPGVKFPDTLQAVDNEEEAIRWADYVLFAVPAQIFRSAFTAALPFLKEGQPVINVAKGIEQKTLMRLSEIAEALRPGAPYAILSGPSHAEEVGKLLPTTVAVGSADPELMYEIQDVFTADWLRVYVNHDVVGMELGGALKNIIALGAGIADGLGYGDNTKAAMMTRGLTEMARLGVSMGAEGETFFGLTGIGDLIVTCTSMHSRNRRCGILLGQGKSPEDATAEVGMVVEGMFTAEAAYALAKKMGVDMPITSAIYHIIQGDIKADDAVKRLMARPSKHEIEDIF
ncbi:MAG: NAD(P)H-dependent glycerol-3-phosphate dehydrogenase [Clostridiales bacterium]|nr:NAD(P)H-dependent glycerol-3-phosphate dehydrogenase [Clostridiales bacterium]